MTHYILRKDVDDFTQSLIDQGADIEIVDEMPKKFSRPTKFVCSTHGLTPHNWNGYGWECIKCENER